MCMSTVFLKKEGKEEEIMKDVIVLEDQGDELKIVDIMGEEKRIKAKLEFVDLIRHKIILRAFS